MKNKSSFKTVFIRAAFLAGTCYSVMAQGMFIRHEIDSNFNGASSVCSYDLDGDGEVIF